MAKKYIVQRSVVDLPDGTYLPGQVFSDEMFTKQANWRRLDKEDVGAMLDRLLELGVVRELKGDEAKGLAVTAPGAAAYPLVDVPPEHFNRPVPVGAETNGGVRVAPTPADWVEPEPQIPTPEQVAEAQAADANLGTRSL